MASAELWPSSAENILYFGVQKRLRAFLYPIFTGWGVGNKLPQSSLRDASPLWDGAFGIAVKFPAKAQSLRARQRLPPRGSCQNRQVLTEGVQSVIFFSIPRFLPVENSLRLCYDRKQTSPQQKV